VKNEEHTMIRSIVKDVLFLGQKSEPATKKDEQVIVDLIDTLRANEKHCVGMAANMIGKKKRMIVYSVGFMVIPMINPVITKKLSPYETEESCLSLTGVRKTTRYENIEVEYLDRNFKKKKDTFTGWTAQIIQHEVDHCEGIII
jgi:peptide deformylase